MREGGLKMEEELSDMKLKEVDNGDIKEEAGSA